MLTKVTKVTTSFFEFKTGSFADRTNTTRKRWGFSCFTSVTWSGIWELFVNILGSYMLQGVQDLYVFS